jgi:hypothetical protein
MWYWSTRVDQANIATGVLAVFGPFLLRFLLSEVRSIAVNNESRVEGGDAGRSRCVRSW